MIFAYFLKPSLFLYTSNLPLGTKIRVTLSKGVFTLGGFIPLKVTVVKLEKAFIPIFCTFLGITTSILSPYYYKKHDLL